MNHVLHFLDDTTQKFKNKIAVIEEEKSCTYAQLQQDSKALATYLLYQKISHQPIIVFMKKGIYALNAFFGSAYAGNFYSLLDPGLPKERIQQIQSILDSPIVLTTKEYESQASLIFQDTTICCIEDVIRTPIDEVAISKAMLSTIDTDPLYINFTSGSTGVPKGVVISHGSVIDFIETFVDTFMFSSKERLANQAPFDFDVSVKDIYTCLYTGATLIIVPQTYFSNPVKLLDFLCEKEITTMIWAVSALSLICTFHALDYKVPKTVKKVLFSGEVMPIAHLKTWREALPDTLFVNLYGPTEITCNCTYHVLESKRDYTQGIPIGKAFKNTGVFLLDENDQEIQEHNKIGEVCVKGRGLALGYYKSEEQTKDRFVKNPLCEAYEQRIYKTGDLAYYNEQFELVFHGRKDFQIKYLGHRIELEEIERKALQIKQVDQFCAVFDDQKHRLYGFYRGTIAKEELVIQLKKSLPTFMIPGKLILVDRMPLTKNGKIDRKALLKNAKGEKR